jgi:hypothetical protein
MINREAAAHMTVCRVSIDVCAYYVCKQIDCLYVVWSISMPCVSGPVSVHETVQRKRALWRGESCFTSGSPTYESGFGGCQENATCKNA